MSSTQKTTNGIKRSLESKVTVVLGAQWGDEGKGKLVHLLTNNGNVVCRCQAGNNSDHRIFANGNEFHLHLLPSGMLYENVTSLIGNGVVIHLPGLFDELATLESKALRNWEERLIISDRAHLVFDFHQQVDGLQEAEKADHGQSLGTTKKGIGPTYTSKASRNGIRVGELIGDYDVFTERFRSMVSSYQRQYPNLTVDIEAELEKYKLYADKLRPLVKDTISYLHKALKDGRGILAEGANAAMLDIDFGTYPYVTSNNCSIGGVITGLGLPPQTIGEIIGVVKTYTTRVGNGPFPTEDFDDLLQTRGREVGLTTGRVRRCGWLDLILLKYSSTVNGYTAICLTKLDILDAMKEIKVGVAYKLNGQQLKHFPSLYTDLSKVVVEYVTLPGWEQSTRNVRKFDELPKNAQNYVRFIEQYLDVPVKWISVGESQEAVIYVA
ncbi:hypothetical protein HA402_002607 [Bradysia odoriphaga]|nr:hypothetical protein HA402_002607 [Bradysia odoriphaga]